MNAFIKSVWENFVDLVFPTLCPGCFRMQYGPQKEICAVCRMRLPYLTTPEEQATLLRKFGGRVLVDYVQAYMYFTKKGVVQRLIHQLKYRGKKMVGYKLGHWFGNELVQQDGPHLHADWLVPVPLHPSRRRERGYNQSEEIARGLTKALGIDTRTDLLWRTRFRGSQTKRNRLQRWLNVEMVFQVMKPELVRGKHIIVVDDVLTTGATLESCVSKLREAGAATVGVIVLAAAR